MTRWIGTRAAALAALAVLAGACRAPSAPSGRNAAPAPAQQAAAGESATTVNDLAQLIAVADARRPDSALLVITLGSDVPRVRATAALVAGQLHMAWLAPRLRQMLGDPDTRVGANAAYALALLHDTTSVAALSHAVRGNATVAREAAFALGQIGAPARDSLAALLAPAVKLPSPVVSELFLAVAKERPVPAWVPARIRTMLLDPVASVSQDGAQSPLWSATYAIARGRYAFGARVMLDAASAPDAEVRALAARGLARSAAGDSIGPDARRALHVLARDPSPHVRINALRSLATYDGENAAIVSGAQDGDANVRVTAAQSATTLLAHDSALFDVLWRADSGFMYHRSLLASAIGAGLTPPRLASWSSRADWRYRASAVEALSVSPDTAAAIASTLRFTYDADGRVRTAAYTTLAAFMDSTDRRPSLRGAMRQALNDDDFFARATAIAALAQRPSAAEAAMVLASRARAERDSAPDARIAIAHYIAAAWRADSTHFPDSLVRAIRALPAPADPLVLAEGQGVSVFGNWPPPMGVARSSDFYVGVVRDVMLHDSTLHAEIVTERGTIPLTLYGGEAPITVATFISLARAGFYRGVRFHRIVPDFVAQDGDPRGDGNGGPGYTIRDELNRHRYDRGAVGMALSGPDTGGSQYFITLAPQPHLDAHYTILGHVSSAAGYHVLDSLVQGDRIIDIRIP